MEISGRIGVIGGPERDNTRSRFKGISGCKILQKIGERSEWALEFKVSH